MKKAIVELEANPALWVSVANLARLVNEASRGLKGRLDLTVQLDLLVHVEKREITVRKVRGVKLAVLDRSGLPARKAKKASLVKPVLPANKATEALPVKPVRRVHKGKRVK